MSPTPWLFGSFFLGGFECSTHLTSEGHRLDVIAATQHDTQAAIDYQLCRAAGLGAVREAARWPIFDCGGRLDLAGLRALATLGREMGLVQIWDLMHYGYPADLDPFTPAFVRRFVAYARAVAEVIAGETPGPHYYTPINEISYNAWAAGEVGYMAPFGLRQGRAYKRALVTAAIAATNAIWEVDSEACILTVDPLVRQHPPPGRPDLREQADHFNQVVVTEAFDMLAGRVAPELGGSRAHLGVVGLNYYACNQWTIPTPTQPQEFLQPTDSEWEPLPAQLAEIQARYGGPLVLAETGATGPDRPGWIQYLTEAAQQTRAAGVDLQGICLYPVITSPDWEDPTAFFDGGLFDVVPQADGTLTRILVPDVAAALREAQALLDPAHLPDTPLPAAPEGKPAADPQIARPLHDPRVKADNFAYATLAVGTTLLIESYTLGPGAHVPAHRHVATDHVLTVLQGHARVLCGAAEIPLEVGESILIPAGVYHSLQNADLARLIVQQVSSPKPWDARFQGPHPAR